ncbi:hypothetical protein [Paenibacillus harenae]|uniref:hypothetical protein n=1 Tax=Paenibacillus harenae TaxID=306543 RepID=UPI002792BC85|nr:hypothetical protein [Paenibacillus harenae]MDQ0062194.1 hypothetical protein [Paenibacillus harenae]
MDVTTTIGDTTVWLNTDSKTLYYSDGHTSPVAIKNAVHELNGSWGTVSIGVEKLGESLLVTIFDNFGEPHINDQISRAIIKDGSIVARSSVLYWNNRDNEKSISTYNGNAIMLDAAVLKLVQPDGTITRSYDLSEITGLDTVFTVEVVFDDYLLVRTHDSRMLIGIRLSTKEFVYLYKQLFTVEEQSLLDQWPRAEIDYPGDQLTLLHRKGNVLIHSSTSKGVPWRRLGGAYGVVYDTSTIDLYQIRPTSSCRLVLFVVVGWQITFIGGATAQYSLINKHCPNR